MSYFDDASLVMIPSGYKASKVYSVKPTDGSGDLTFTRSNDTATRVGPDGLIEKVRTNLILQSEGFDTASWNKTTDGQVTITANAAVAPNGTTTAEKMIPSAIAGFHCVSQTITLSASEFTISVFAKAAENSFLQIFDSLTTDFANFNLTTGAVGSTDNYVASIQSVGNGWFRCTATKAVPSGSFVFRYGVVTTATAVRGESFTGNGTDGLLIWGAQLESGVATPYIPTTTAAVSVGPVANVPRLDYLNSSCPRLLLEPQRTNSLTYSEQFNNAAWTKFNAPTITTNIATAPDGTDSADGIQAADASNYKRAAQTISVSANSTLTFSFFVKKETSETAFGGFTMYFQGGTPKIVYGIVNAVNGTVTYASSDLTATTKVESYGNYWRIASTATDNGSNTLCEIGYYATLSTNGTALNTGAGSVRTIWGFQAEVGSYATSYIPTLGAAVTRGADFSQKSSISSLFGATATTFVLDFVKKENAIGWTITGSNGSKLFSLAQFDTLAGRPRMVFDDGVDTGSSLAVLSNGPHKIAISYATNDTRIYIDGTLVLTDTSCTYYQMDRIGVNATAWTGFTNNTNAFEINQFLIIPAATSSADLAALTA